ncbi:unnamed protein product [Moneuplotes crassus]|uniref:Uncharacterized protein n=1 Tax=Euplotes crassus TaxID=5936 RepID=A0AAD1UC21_EUPCR|nr:unnamed protein product [Moneuplotes crassus]
MYLVEQHQHRKHLHNIQSTVDNKVPRQFLKNLVKRRLRRNIQSNHEKARYKYADDNIDLLNKLISTKNRKNLLSQRAKNSNPRSLNFVNRKKEIERINNENTRFNTRLLSDVKPTITREDFKKHEKNYYDHKLNLTSLNYGYLLLSQQAPHKREGKIKTLKNNSKKLDRITENSSKFNRVFSADDKETLRMKKFKSPMTDKRMNKKIKFKPKSPVILRPLKKRVIKGLNQSTLDVFSTTDNIRRINKFKSKIMSKSPRAKKKKPRVKPKRGRNHHTTKDMKILNIQTGHPMSPSPEETSFPERNERGHYQNPSPTDSQAPQINSTKNTSEMRPDSKTKDLINPKEMPLRINTIASNTARKSEVVRNVQKKPKIVNRIQSKVSVVNNPTQSSKKESRNSSANYNPISRQTTYRGDSFGNKEGLKKGKGKRRRKDTYSEANEKILDVPEDQRDMKSVIKEEEHDINESSSSEKYTEPEEFKDDESRSKSMVDSVSDIRSRNDGLSPSPSLKSITKKRQKNKKNIGDTKSGLNSKATPELKSNTNKEGKLGKDIPENNSDIKSQSMSENKSQAVSDKNSVDQSESQSPEGEKEEAKEKKKSLLIENHLHKAKIKGNNYHESTSNITLNQSNINDSKLTKYSDMKPNKSNVTAQNRRSSQQTKIRDQSGVYPAKRTISKMMTEKIPEEDCTPLKDKTTFNTPTEIVSNFGGREGGQNVSQKTITTNNQLKEKSQRKPSVIRQKRNTINHQIFPHMKRNDEDDEDVSTIKDQLNNLKMTDETNSKNMSVSDNTNTDQGKRKSFISNRSKTNEFVSIKHVPEDRRKSSFVHLSTIQESRPKKMLEVTCLDTMKNIPSPESFISGGMSLGQGDKKKEESKFLMTKELETIKDDNSSRFQSDQDFDDSENNKRCKKSISQDDDSVSSKDNTDIAGSHCEKEKPFFFNKNKDNPQEKDVPINPNFKRKQTVNVFSRQLPGEKENSNFSLNDKSEKSKASRKENATKESSMFSHTKKRATTFVSSSSQNFFGIAEGKFRNLVRKKSTSNFLPNYGIMEQNKSIIDNNLDISLPSQIEKKDSTSSNNVSEEDEFVNELVDAPPMPLGELSRKSSVDDYRKALMKQNKRISDNRVGFESTENSQLIGSYLSKNSFKSNISHTLQMSKKKSSSETVVELKSVVLQKSVNSQALRGLKSGKNTSSNFESDQIPQINDESH